MESRIYLTGWHAASVHCGTTEPTLFRMHPVSHDSVMDYLLLHAKVSEMQIFQELKWEINGNPGKVCIRTHKTWQGHQPKRTVIVRSAFGKLFKIVMLDSDALSLYIFTAIHVS